MLYSQAQYRQFDIEAYPFPPIDMATEEGIVAMGGDLCSERLISAYAQGIFPWYSSDDPILWWSPDPRFILFPEKLKISKSMRTLFNQHAFEVTFNQDFGTVISQCATITRNGQDDTWITDEMKKAYLKLHKLGFANSVEVYKQGELVGGLYGLIMGKAFFGESMFSKVSNASKFGFISLVEELRKLNFDFIDCQVYTDHLKSLGAEELPRNQFLSLLKNAIK